jgi:hypothetical protein
VYRCGGREITSRHHLETGRKCEATALRADHIELSLLAALCDAVTDPANFAKALEASLADLRRRAAELDGGVGVLRKALADVDGELCRLATDWVRGHIPDDKRLLMERSALERREHFQAQLEALGCDDLAELERTNELLRAAEGALEATASPPADDPPLSLSFGFHHGWFPPLPPGWSPKEFLAGSGSAWLSYDTLPDAVTPEGVGATLREVLSRLQAEVWARPEGLEVRGLVSLHVPKVGAQASSPGART